MLLHSLFYFVYREIYSIIILSWILACFYGAIGIAFTSIQNQIKRCFLIFNRVLFVISIIFILLYTIINRKPGQEHLFSFNILDITNENEIKVFIMNILMFMPLGTTMAIEKHNVIKKAFVVFIISLIIESVQYVFMIGIFEINDLISNSIGGIICLLIVELERHIQKKYIDC